MIELQTLYNNNYECTYYMNFNSYAAIKIHIIHFKWIILYLLTSVNTYMHVKCNSLVEWFGTNGAFIFFTIPGSLQLIFTITTNRNMVFDNLNIIHRIMRWNCETNLRTNSERASG